MYEALYGPKGLVIFDHPYNADSVRAGFGPAELSGAAQISRICTAVLVSAGLGHGQAKAASAPAATAA